MGGWGRNPLRLVLYWMHGGRAYSFWALAAERGLGERGRAFSVPTSGTKVLPFLVGCLLPWDPSRKGRILGILGKVGIGERKGEGRGVAYRID